MNDSRLIRVLTALVCEPWLLTPQMHKTLSEIAFAHAAGGETEAAQHAVADAMGIKTGKKSFDVNGSTAIISFEGVIARKFSSVLNSSGVCSIDIAERMLVSAGNDDMIDSIVMIFDSPGGVAMGVSEVGTTIANINAKKPVVSYVDGLCCSAAYWLASQSSGIYATQSAEVGSIGAYMAVLDRTRQLEEEGIKVDMFRSGKHKGMGYPGTRLSDEQRTMLQDRIDGLGKDFKQAVRSGRGKNISDEVMQGQSFSADAAIRHALIDNIADFATAIRDAGALGKQKLSRRGKTV